MIINDLIKKFPSLSQNTYMYDVEDALGYADLDKVLSGLGYKISDPKYKKGEFKTISGYKNMNIIKI